MEYVAGWASTVSQRLCGDASQDRSCGLAELAANEYQDWQLREGALSKSVAALELAAEVAVCRHSGGRRCAARCAAPETRM